jgi:hypothetical protein
MQVVYPAGSGPSRFHVIFRELCSRFETPDDLRDAEKFLSDIIRSLSATMAGS